MGISQNEGKFYENYWADKKGHLSDFNLKWPILSQLIPKEKGINVVDFGCGNGAILSKLLELNQGAIYEGLDVSQTAIEAAQKNLPNVKFHKIFDGQKFPLQNEVADFIFSSEVIEHIYDTENAFGEMARILKLGGRVLLTTPYHGFIKNLALILFGFDRHFNPTGPHIRFFSKKALFELLKKNGFEVEKYGFYGRFYPLSHSIYVLAQKRADTGEIL